MVLDKKSFDILIKGLPNHFQVLMVRTPDPGDEKMQAEKPDKHKLYLNLNT